MRVGSCSWSTCNTSAASAAHAGSLMADAKSRDGGAEQTAHASLLSVSIPTHGQACAVERPVAPHDADRLLSVTRERRAGSRRDEDSARQSTRAPAVHH
eukprot:2824099-Prymnesium_polylepis.1